MPEPVAWRYQKLIKPLFDLPAEHKILQGRVITCNGDEVIEAHGVKVLVDPFSMPNLVGADIDFVDGLNGTGFSITNPNTVSGCGCGTSFQLKEGEEEGEGTTASAGGCSTCASA